MKIQIVAPLAGEREDYFLPADKLIVGNPQQTVWMKYTDATSKFFVGTWSSEIGKWNISYTEEEYCELLEGRSVITDESGHSVTVSKGDTFVIPRGFVGTWEVVSPTKKKFVIYEAGSQ
jgi:uncharacterized cupin superfamily protein